MSQARAGVGGRGGPPAPPSLTLRCFCSWTSCCRVRWSCCFWNSANRSCFCSCCCCFRARSSCCSCCSLSAGSTGPARAPRSSAGLGLPPPPPPAALGMAPGSTGFTSTAGARDRRQGAQCRRHCALAARLGAQQATRQDHQTHESSARGGSQVPPLRRTTFCLNRRGQSQELQ